MLSWDCQSIYHLYTQSMNIVINILTLHEMQTSLIKSVGNLTMSPECMQHLHGVVSALVAENTFICYFGRILDAYSAL